MKRCLYFSSSSLYSGCIWGECYCGSEQFCLSELRGHWLPSSYSELAERQETCTGQQQCCNRARYKYRNVHLINKICLCILIFYVYLFCLLGGRTLQILKAKMSDGGKYSCVAMNPAGEAQKIIYLTVFGQRAHMSVYKKWREISYFVRWPKSPGHGAFLQHYRVLLAQFSRLLMGCCLHPIIQNMFDPGSLDKPNLAQINK